MTAGRSSVAECLVAYLATAIAGGDIFAQAPKLGVEIQVNSYTTDRQERASAAMDDDGDFVVVWESLDQDGNVDGVFAQRFDATGARKGIEFQVNAYTTGSSPTLGIQDQPGVAMDADGDFVVVWRSLARTATARRVAPPLRQRRSCHRSRFPGQQSHYRSAELAGGGDGGRWRVRGGLAE